MLNKKTFIFFTIEAGLAHITRSLAIAQKLIKKGHRVIFTLTKNKQFLVKDKNIEVLDIGEFFNDEQVTPKIKDPNYVYQFILEEIKILKKVKPDFAVVDFRLSALVSCKILGVPLVFITNSDGLPFDVSLPNLGLPGVVKRVGETILKKIISNFKFEYINSLAKAGKLIDKNFKKDKLFDIDFIIPEPESYMPSEGNNSNKYYVGPIFWDGFEAYKPDWLDKIKPDGRTIYLTFGGTGYDGKKLLNLSELLVKKGYRVIVSSSNIVEAKKFKKLKNLYIERFLPGFEVSKRVDLVLCHGGIGTLTQALLSKRPVVSVPFNPDQYLHGFRFQELGLGICVSNLRLFNLLSLNWENFQKKGRDLKIDPILKAVEKILQNREKYKAPIEKFAKLFSMHDGAVEAASVILKLAQG